MKYYYLLALIISSGGLLYADRRLNLVFFRNKRLGALCLLIGLGFFLCWDLIGLVNNIFATNQVWVSGLYAFSPNLPLEEFLFLSFFCYLTVITWELVCTRIS